MSIEHISLKLKSPADAGLFIKVGADLLSQDLVLVPSALAGLTTLFGMGRGDPRRSKHHYFYDNVQYFNKELTNMGKL